MHLMQITGATKPATFPKASLTLENSSDKAQFSVIMQSHVMWHKQDLEQDESINEIVNYLYES